MSLIQSAKGALDFGVNDQSGARRMQIRGIAVIIGALVTAGVSFAVLIGLTPIQPDARVTLSAIVINGFFVFAMLWLIGWSFAAYSLRAGRGRKRPRACMCASSVCFR